MGDAVVITAMTAGETTDTDARLRELIAEALHTATRDATRAVALATEAEQLAVALGDDASRAEAIYALGRSLAMSSKYPAALEAYARALALCEAHGFTTHLPALLHAQGRIYRNMGDGAEAFRLFTRGLALAREAGDRIREASILADLGVLYAMFDVFETALDLQGQALALARAVPDFPDLGYLVQALGHTYRMQGDALLDEGDRTAAEAAHDTALLLLTEALALAQAEGERQLVAMCGGDLGIIALARGDSVRCRELLRVGDAVVAQLGADRFRGDYFYGLGMVEAVEGNYHAALVELESAREIYERIGVRPFVGLLHRHISACYEALGDPARALAHYKQFSQYDRITAREKARQAAMLTALNEQLRERTLRDPLTGLYNRRYLDETLRREVANAGRTGLPVSVVTVDVDRFKGVNDTYGHAAGDAVLRAIAEALRAQTRAGDVVCRLGGEEFVVVLPGAGAEAAWRWAEGRRAALAALCITHGEATLQVTFSAGVATATGNGETAEALLTASDEALYAAKQRGRNRVVASSPYRLTT